MTKTRQAVCTPAQAEKMLDLGIDPETFDLARAIDMIDAAKLVRGRGGRRINVQTVRRFANPKRGCKPLGSDGPWLVLPTVWHSGSRLTMPEWVAVFEAARIAAGRGAIRSRTPGRTGRQETAAQRRAKAELERQGFGRVKA